MHIIVLPNIRNISEIQFLDQIFDVLGSLEAHPERYVTSLPFSSLLNL